MIFAAETEEGTLRVFEDEQAAVSYCEGLDVEAAVWLFWDANGHPLQPDFIKPNKRGLFLVANGTYRLVIADETHHASLIEALENIIAVDGPEPLNSRERIQQYLISRRHSKGPPDGA